MGSVHRAEGDDAESTLRLVNTCTDESIPVRIDPAMADLYRDTGIFDDLPDACPFLRRMGPSGTAVCTIHDSRPWICREYRCWRLLILDSRGRRAGRIQYRNTLRTDDLLLAELWAIHIAPIGTADMAAWELEVRSLLGRAGYTLRA